METLKQYASPYNWSAEATKSPNIPRKVILHDLTLEGDAEEMAGIRFSHQDRVEIAKDLAKAGVDRISMLGNSPRPSRAEIASAEAVVALGLPTKVGAFVKVEGEIDIARRIGLWGVTILIDVNDASAEGPEGGNAIIERCKTLSSLARDRGLHTCLMGMDGTRTRPEFLERVVRELDPFIDEFTISDSMGVISPFGMHYLAQLVRGWTHKPLQVHPHNHTSAATSVAVGAVLGGVEIVHTTVNGVGEFTGICPLEEFAVAVEMHAGASTALDLSYLQELSQRVARATGIAVSPHKPVVGSAAFAMPETEAIQQHVYGMHRRQQFPQAFPYPPHLVGATGRMSIGRKCHAYTVLYNLEALGYETDFATAEKIATHVRKVLGGRKGHVLATESEFLDLVKKGGFVLQAART